MRAPTKYKGDEETQYKERKAIIAKEEGRKGTGHRQRIDKEVESIKNARVGFSRAAVSMCIYV
jgi:hypothetical protein